MGIDGVEKPRTKTHSLERRQHKLEVCELNAVQLTIIRFESILMFTI